MKSPSKPFTEKKHEMSIKGQSSRLFVFSFVDGKTTAGIFKGESKHHPFDWIRNLFISMMFIFQVIGITSCSTTPTSTSEILINLSPVPTRTIAPYPTATYFANPTALTASAIAPTPTQNFYSGLPITGSECIPENPILKVKVTRIIDGDTIEIDIDGNLMQLRYIGIEAPKLDANGNPAKFSAEAAAKNGELVAGKDVFLIRDLEPTNGYGLLLGYIITDEVFVNYQLVREGYAKAVPYNPNISCKFVFSSAESLARNENLGMWKNDP